jgi:hypothetical protein
MTTTHQTRFPRGISERVLHKSRTCRDCGGGYRYTNTHHNLRYCAACLPQHPRRCTTCTQPFHPKLDADRLCPVHTVHPALFAKDRPHGQR